MRWGDVSISSVIASEVREALVIPLYERLSVRSDGKSFVSVGIISSLERGGMLEPVAFDPRATDTKSPKLHPSRSSSSSLGKNPLMLLSGKLGSAKDLSARRFARMSTRRVCAKGWSTIVDRGSVGVGTERSPVREDWAKVETEGVAIENARACPADLVGGADAGSLRVCVLWVKYCGLLRLEVDEGLVGGGDEDEDLALDDVCWSAWA